MRRQRRRRLRLAKHARERANVPVMPTIFVDDSVSPIPQGLVALVNDTEEQIALDVFLENKTMPAKKVPWWERFFAWLGFPR